MYAIDAHGRVRGAGRLARDPAQTVQNARSTAGRRDQGRSGVLNPGGQRCRGLVLVHRPQARMIVGFALEVDGTFGRGRGRRAQARPQRPTGSDPATHQCRRCSSGSTHATCARASIQIPATGTRRKIVPTISTGSLRERSTSCGTAAPIGRAGRTRERDDRRVLGSSCRCARECPSAMGARLAAMRVSRDARMRRQPCAAADSCRARLRAQLTRKRGGEGGSDNEDAQPKPLRINVLKPGKDLADYVMLRWDARRRLPPTRPRRARSWS